MRYHFPRFPDGKTKAVTLSYDDGYETDIRMAQTLDRYGMKGTFNINSAYIGISPRATKAELQTHLLDRGHELAVHGACHKAPGLMRTADGLLVHLSRLSEPLPKLQIQQDRNLQALSNALDLISQSIQNANTPSVEMLATSCKMSVSNFRKVFRKFVGLSPKDYITKCCINKAQQLLLTTHKSILEVCLESGFRDLSWFNHQFLEKANMTPSAYRKHFNKQS